LRNKKEYVIAKKKHTNDRKSIVDHKQKNAERKCSAFERTFTWTKPFQQLKAHLKEYINVCFLLMET